MYFLPGILEAMTWKSPENLDLDNVHRQFGKGLSMLRSKLRAGDDIDIFKVKKSQTKGAKEERAKERFDREKAKAEKHAARMKERERIRNGNDSDKEENCKSTDEHKEGEKRDDEEEGCEDDGKSESDTAAHDVSLISAILNESDKEEHEEESTLTTNPAPRMQEDNAGSLVLFTNLTEHQANLYRVQQQKVKEQNLSQSFDSDETDYNPS